MTWAGIPSSAGDRGHQPTITRRWPWLAWPGPQTWFSWRRRMQMQGSLFRLVWIAPISVMLRLKQTSMHTHISMRWLRLRCFCTAPGSWDAPGRCWKRFLLHNTAQHNLPCSVARQTGQATLTKSISWRSKSNSRAKVIGAAIGSKVHGQHGSQLESSPRLVSHSESQCGEAKVAVRPSRRLSQLCSAATERHLQASQVRGREPAKATARSRLHPGPIRCPCEAHGLYQTPAIHTPARQSTRPRALTPTPLHHDRVTHICTSPSPLGTPDGLEHRTANPSNSGS